MEESLFLSQVVKKVTVIHRGETLRASQIMQERAKANPKISFLWNTEVKEVLGDTRVTGLRLHDTKEDTETELALDGMFLAIGHEPASEFMKDQLELDIKNYIKVFNETTATSVKGVFACGDVVDHRYRQAVTAAGTGCMAALDAERFLMHGKE
jgi:thioredoxin reductase (NADPH)